jgi:hypothetical protein
MLRWKIAKVPNGTISEDGKTIWLRLIMDDGQEHQMEIAYDQLDFTTQALLQLAHGAYQQQVKTGNLPFEKNYITNPMSVEGYRVLRDQEARHLLIQCHGRQIPTQPIGMGSFRVDEQQARGLGRQLLESANLLKQTNEPS